MVRSQVAIVSHPRGLIDVFSSYDSQAGTPPCDTWSSLPPSNRCHAYRPSGETPGEPLGTSEVPSTSRKLPIEAGGCFLQELEEYVECRVDIAVCGEPAPGALEKLVPSQFLVQSAAVAARL